MDFYINDKLLNSYNQNKRYTVAFGGRSSGKSLQFGALSIIYAINNPKSRILCVRGTQNKISESSLQVLKDVIDMMGVAQYFDISEHTLSAKNGSEFLFYGAKTYQSFKSLQGINLVWVDEATEVSWQAWDVLIPTIREANSRFLISFNPTKATDYVYDTFIEHTHPEASVIELQYTDNPFFPEVLQVEMEYDRRTNHAKYLHIWEGELITAVEGALWNLDMIHHVSDAEAKELIDSDYSELEKIVVSIDPSTTSKATSDACGLVVVGKYIGRNHYIVIDDLTAIMSPATWAKKAIMLYDKYKANYIVAEANQGGKMIKTILRSIREDLPYKDVYAKKGKILRAEPVAALYEQGKVDHLHAYTNLEYEMTTYTGASSDASPNSLDALVYAVLELASPKQTAPDGMVPATGLLRF